MKVKCIKLKLMMTFEIFDLGEIEMYLGAFGCTNAAISRKPCCSSIFKTTSLYTFPWTPASSDNGYKFIIV
jgi:hypothetical protein